MIKLNPIESGNGYNLIYMPDVELSEVFDLRPFNGRALYIQDQRTDKQSSITIRVKSEFWNEFKKCLVVDGTLFPQLIIYKDGSSLPLFKYNEIIGSRWIKIFPPGEADKFFNLNKEEKQ